MENLNNFGRFVAENEGYLRGYDAEVRLDSMGVLSAGWRSKNGFTYWAMIMGLA
jgi:hypothetical protein